MKNEEYIRWLKQLDKELTFDGLMDGEDAVDLHEMIFELCEKLEQESCDDCVSREAVENITWEKPNYTDALNVLTEVRDKVRALPSVQPKPKTGHWILADEQSKEDIENDNYRFICSECQCSDIHAKNTKVPYCWKCGSQMKGEVET